MAPSSRGAAQLERLARYLCRAPGGQERLEETAGGKLRDTLKRPWRDGTIDIVLEPMDLLARVCALAPPPRFHMALRSRGLTGAEPPSVRHPGVLSSHAKVRAEVASRRRAGAQQLLLLAYRQ